MRVFIIIGLQNKNNSAVMRWGITFLFTCFYLTIIAQENTNDIKKDTFQDSLGIHSQKVDQVELFSTLDSINYFFGLTLGYSLEGITFEPDPALIAVASDDRHDIDVPVFDINDFKGLCDLIEDRFLPKG